MDEVWPQVEKLFHAALERPAAEREAWIEGQPGLDAAVRAEARSLLDADRRSGELSALAPARAVEAAVEAALGKRFGPYRTERLLGRGGMGAVYLARRVDGEFEQTVALKVMAAHLAGPEYARSFLNERQLLAALAHPHITRLLDGGVTPAGDPYLVTEYIEGRPLDRYCEEEKLTLDARIRLFLQVCDAVEFAHRNLIVHGDLKPANVLVTAEGEAKLLDFGTARLLRAPDGAVTQFALATPRYASPEQLRGEPVSTVSDVFSLGVMLYEMLTGAWPFGDPKSPADGMERVLRGRNATAPAKAVSQSAALRRSASLARLRRQLQGDLSTILLKMLDGEPAGRYGSVREVREDLERYRQGRPVHARPRSAWYAAWKFAARNWLAVSAAAAVAIALAALTAVSAYQSAQARAQAARAQRVSEFARNTFLSASDFWASPLRGQHQAIQFSDILDNAASRVGQELGNDPAAEADLRETLGSTYARLGDPAKGEEQLMAGLRLLPLIPGGAPPGLAVRLYLSLCNTRDYAGRYAEALPACREAVAICRSGDRGDLGGVLHDTAYTAVNAGQPLADAEAMYRESLRHPRLNQALFAAIVNGRIGMLRLRQGDLDGGERILLGAERALRGQGEPQIEIVPVLYARAFAADARGHYAEAVALMAEALDLVTRRRVWFMEPDERALQLAAYEALAGTRSALARLREVEPRLSYARGAAVDRIRHHLFAGMVEARCESADTAEGHLRAAIGIQEREMSAQPDLTVEACVRLMELLRAEGRTREAAEAAQQGLAAAARAYGGYFEAHPFVAALR